MGCFCSKDSKTSPALRVDNDPGLVSGAGRYSEQEMYPGEFGGLPRRVPNGNDKRAPRPVKIKRAPKRVSVSQVKWKNPIDVRYEYSVPGRKPRHDNPQTSSESASDDSTIGDNPPGEYAGLPGPIPNGKDRPPRPVRIRPRPRRSTLWSVRWSSVKGGKKAAEKRGSLDDPDDPDA
ncbi:hypothetical protein MRS44_009168 [Fusarium solani]|uniref:uncharacterized protein n=1 Tax=Fusarium solani TaxID=169388 RepID=UPI0032C4A421|nr:hypothetical protein MRS44_009168 [Fusarium solani]